MNTKQAKINRLKRDIDRRIERVRRDEREGQITVEEINSVMIDVAKKLATIQRLKQETTI